MDSAGHAASATGALVGKAAGAAGVGLGTYSAAKNAAEGNYGQAGLNALDAAASGALLTGVGTGPAAVYLGARAAHGALDSALSDDTRDTIGGTINQLVRNTGKAFGRDWGVDDSAYLQHKAEQSLRNPPTPSTSQTSFIGQSSANPTDQRLAAGTQASPAVSAAPGAAPAAPVNDIKYDPATNTYSGKNIGPNATINGADPRGGFVGNGVDSGAAAAQRVADIYKSINPDGAGTLRAPVVAHSGNSWEARNNLRNLEIAATSMTNTQYDRRGRPVGNLAGEAYNKALAADAEARNAQPGVDLKAAEINAGLQKTAMGEQGANLRGALDRQGRLQEAMINAGGKRNTELFKLMQERATQQRHAAAIEKAGGDYGKAAQLLAAGGDLDGAKEVQAMATGATDAVYKARTAQDSAAKATADRLGTMYTTRDPKTGQATADTAAVGRHMQRAEQMVAESAAALRKQGDTAGAAALEQQGVHGMTAGMHEQLRQKIALEDLQARSGSGPRAVSPQDMDITGKSSTWYGAPTYKLRGGGTLLQRHVDYENGGSAVLPNDWVDNRTRRFDALKQF